MRLTPKRAAQLKRLTGAERHHRLSLPGARGRAGRLRSPRRGRHRAPGARASTAPGARPRRGGALAELRLVVQDQRIVVEQDRLRLDPRTGQTFLDFDGVTLEKETRESFLMGMVRPSSRPPTPRRSGSRGPRRGRRSGTLGSGGGGLRARGRDRSRVCRGLNNLGLLQHRMGRYERAQACYRAALDADDSCCQAAFNLGSLHEDLSDLGSAIGWYRRPGDGARLCRRPLQPGRRARQGGPGRGRRPSTGGGISSSIWVVRGRAHRALHLEETEMAADDGDDKPEAGP